MTKIRSFRCEQRPYCGCAWRLPRGALIRLELLDVAVPRRRSTAAVVAARLHAGLAVVSVVEHHDREVTGPLPPMVARLPIPISIVAVAGDHDDAAVPGCASASPRPIGVAPPIAPQR